MRHWDVVTGEALGCVRHWDVVTGEALECDEALGCGEAINKSMRILYGSTCSVHVDYKKQTCVKNSEPADFIIRFGIHYIVSQTL